MFRVACVHLQAHIGVVQAFNQCITTHLAGEGEDLKLDPGEGRYSHCVNPP